MILTIERDEPCAGIDAASRRAKFLPLAGCPLLVDAVEKVTANELWN